MRAKPSGEAQGNHTAHGSRDLIVLDAHLDQAEQGCWRVFGMQWCEEQMAGYGRLDGDFGGLQVAHFTTEDDVGVLSDGAVQRDGKVMPLRLLI